MRLLPFLLPLLLACSSTPQDVLIQVRPTDFRRELQEVRDLGFDVAGVDLHAKTFDVVMPTDTEGYFKVQINPNVAAVRPLFAPDSEYKNPDEVAQFLTEKAGMYPNLADLKIIGTSLENRPIYAIKLSADVRMKSAAKKVVLFDSMHHAREVMTVEVALDIVDYLVKNYATDTKVRNWLNTTEVWVVPMLNVDGNAKVWAGNSMWRKNTRGGYGVDINRNYPYAWNTCNGSSGSTGSDTYRGPSAGSEPETQALMKLMGDIKPHIGVSFHTYSEIVIYPLGCPNQQLPAADKTIIETVGRELASKLVRDSGRGTYDAGTSYDLLYPVDGGSIDWAYATHKIMPFVIEFNGSAAGFQPSYSLFRDKTVNMARAAWQYVLDRVHNGPLLR